MPSNRLTALLDRGWGLLIAEANRHCSCGQCEVADALLQPTLPVLPAAAPREHLVAALTTAGTLALEKDDRNGAELAFQEVLVSSAAFARGWSPTQARSRPPAPSQARHR
jgi:hypothetical protein